MQPTILQQLKSGDPAARAAAAEELGASKDPAAAQPLIAALRDPEPLVREAAARGLGELGGEPAIRALSASLWDLTSLVQSEAAAALMRIGPPAIPALAPGLQSTDPQVCQITRWMLVMISGQPLAEEPAGFGPYEGGPGVNTQVGGSGTSGAGGLVDRLEKASMSCNRAAGRAAARQLCDSDDPAYWEALVTAEVRWDDDIRAAAAAALAKLCDLGDVRGLRPEAALAVLERLDQDEAEHAPEVFRRALGHADPRVRSGALAYLNDLGEPPIDDDEKRLRALIDGHWDTVEALGPGALTDLLIAQLGAGDRHDRKEAVEALGRLKDGRAAEALLGALGDAEEDVRGLAVRALAGLREQRAVEPITRLLRDQDRWVRKEAAEALGTLGSEAALPALAEAIKDRQKSIRQAAAGALGRIGGAGAVAPLGAALSDRDVEVRRIAAEGLARSRCAEAVPYLSAAMGDADDAVWAQAARGLAEVPADAASGPSAAAALEAALLAGLNRPGREGRRAAAGALQARGWQPADDAQRARFLVAMENPLAAEGLGEAAVEPLCVALLDGGHYYLCETAAECLGRILDTRATPALTKALRSSTDLVVRGAAARALGRLRDPAALPALQAALQSEKEQWVKPHVQGAWASVIAAAQGDRLAAALEDAEWKVGLRAAILLARAGSPLGVDWLDRAAGVDDTLLRDQAVAALGRIGGAVAVQRLIGHVGPGSGAAGAAVDALVALGPVTAGPMADALAGMGHNGRRVMLQGLARMGASATAALCAALSSADTELKRIACDALGGTYGREDIPHKPTAPLVLLLADPDARVRRSAAHALELLGWTPANDQELALLQAAREPVTARRSLRRGQDEV
jgi:HEAT repeat protein